MQTTSSFPVEMSSKSGEREIGQISQDMGSRFGSCLVFNMLRIVRLVCFKKVLELL